MQCKQVQLLLNDYIDRELSVFLEKTVIDHCAACPRCAKDLALLQQQQQALASLTDSPLSEYTKKRLFRQATADDSAVSGYPPVKSSYRFAAVAMLAVVVLLLSFIYYPGNNNAQSTHLVTVDNGVHTVKVAIDSRENLDGVSFRVNLSDNLELAGFGNKKQIQWTGGLHKGVNIISLPIIGIARGNGEVITRIRLHGKEKTMRINTRYRQADSMMYGKGNIRQS